jgi:hypothetical protein
MIRIWLAALVFAALTGASLAQVQPPGGGLQPPVTTLPLSPVPNIATTPGVASSHGSGLVTGSPGGPQSVTLPGSAVPGTLINNGNGTSTIMIPGSPSEVVPTPR